MKKASHNTLLVQLQIRQNDCHTERVNDIRLTGLTKLPFMRLVSNMISLFYHGNVRGRMVFLYAVDQFFV